MEGKEAVELIIKYSGDSGCGWFGGRKCFSA